MDLEEAEIEERNMVDYSECEDEYRTERAEAQEEYYRHWGSIKRWKINNWSATAARSKIKIKPVVQFYFNLMIVVEDSKEKHEGFICA